MADKPAKKPWPTIGGRASVFATDPHFMSREARGLAQKVKKDAEVVAFQSKGHAAIDLRLPGSIRHKPVKGMAA
jgi:hypothetical protein